MRPISYTFDDTDLRHRRYRLGYLLSTIKAYSNEEQPKPETKALTDKARPKPLALKPAKPLRPADPPHLKVSVKNDRRYRYPKYQYLICTERKFGIDESLDLGLRH